MHDAGPAGVPDEHADLILSYIWIRRFVGIVGATTPALVILYFWWTGHPITKSISDAYHTGAREVIVGGLSAIAVFLWAYKGHQNGDEWISDKAVARIAALSAFVAAHFPNKLEEDVKPTWTQEVICPETVADLHNLATLVFYLALAYFCLDNFCRHGKVKQPSASKLDRVLIYRICGIYIVGTAIGIAYVHLYVPEDLQGTKIFWLEATGVWAFSLCWGIKGKALSPVVNLIHRVRHRN